MAGKIDYGTTAIRYKVERRKRKTLAIEVHPNRTVHVIAPMEIAQERIELKIAKRAGWIAKQMRSFDSVRTARTPEWVSGENLYYLGRQLRLRVLNGKNEIKKVGNRLYVVVPERNPKLVEKLVVAWLKQRAKQIFHQRLDFHRFILKNEKIRVNKVRIRKILKRWGSCTKDHNIVLNTALIHASPSCIDYVIIHELCHLKYHNHGAKFWQLLERYCPDWRKRKKKLENLYTA